MKTRLHTGRIQRLAAIFAAVVLAVSLCLPAYAAAATLEIEGADMTVTLPDGVLALTADTPADDPVWVVAGILDTAEKKQQLAKDGIVAELYAFDGACVIAVSTKSSDYTKGVYNLNDLDEENRAAFIEHMQPTSADGKTTGTATWYDNGGGQVPFFCVDLSSTAFALETEEPVYERVYGTLYNGMTVSFDLYTATEPIAEAYDALLRAIVDSAVITNMLETPTLSNLPLETVWGLGAFAVLLVLLIAFFIYRSRASRKEKRDKLELANRIAAYRQQKQGSEDEGTGALRFVNETVHDDNAIRAYANFHAYRKNIFMPVFTIFIGTVALVVAWITGGDWWIMLLLALCVLFCAYKLITAATSIIKTQKRVFSKLRSRKAAYYFYDGDFRITGLQASNLHPYFQITSLHETKDYFYMYFGVDNTYYIKKDGFKQGDADTFRTFMKEKLGKKCKFR